MGEQLDKEQLKKAIDTIKTTLKDKREYAKSLMSECHNLEEQLYKLQRELNRPDLLYKYFKEKKEDNLCYYYITNISEEDSTATALRIRIDENIKIDIADFYIRTFENAFVERTLEEISYEEFIEAYNKVFEEFKTILLKGE